MNTYVRIVAASVLSLTTLSSCESRKQKIKNKVVKECIESGDKQFTEAKTRAIFHEYCKCSGEKTAEQFTQAEWEEFEKMKKDHREVEMQARLLPVIQPCLDELQAKMGAGAQ